MRPHPLSVGPQRSSTDSVSAAAAGGGGGGGRDLSEVLPLPLLSSPVLDTRVGDEDELMHDVMKDVRCESCSNEKSLIRLPSGLTWGCSICDVKPIAPLPIQPQSYPPYSPSLPLGVNRGMSSPIPQPSPAPDYPNLGVRSQSQASGYYPYVNTLPVAPNVLSPFSPNSGLNSSSASSDSNVSGLVGEFKMDDTAADGGHSSHSSSVMNSPTNQRSGSAQLLLRPRLNTYSGDGSRPQSLVTTPTGKRQHWNAVDTTPPSHGLQIEVDLSSPGSMNNTTSLTPLTKKMHVGSNRSSPVTWSPAAAVAVCSHSNSPAPPIPRTPVHQGSRGVTPQQSSSPATPYGHPGFSSPPLSSRAISAAGTGASMGDGGSGSQSPTPFLMNSGAPNISGPKPERPPVRLLSAYRDVFREGRSGPIPQPGQKTLFHTPVNPNNQRSHSLGSPNYPQHFSFATASASYAPQSSQAYQNGHAPFQPPPPHGSFSNAGANGGLENGFLMNTGDDDSQVDQPTNPGLWTSEDFLDVPSEDHVFANIASNGSSTQVNGHGNGTNESKSNGSSHDHGDGIGKDDTNEDLICSQATEPLQLDSNEEFQFDESLQTAAAPLAHHHATVIADQPMNHIHDNDESGDESEVEENEDESEAEIENESGGEGHSIIPLDVQVAPPSLNSSSYHPIIHTYRYLQLRYHFPCDTSPTIFRLYDPSESLHCIDGTVNCQVCGFNYAQKAFRQHLITHSNLLDYRCGRCGQARSQSGNGHVLVMPNQKVTKRKGSQPKLTFKQGGVLGRYCEKAISTHTLCPFKDPLTGVQCPYRFHPQQHLLECKIHQIYAHYNGDIAGQFFLAKQPYHVGEVISVNIEVMVRDSDHLMKPGQKKKAMKKPRKRLTTRTNSAPASLPAIALSSSSNINLTSLPGVPFQEMMPADIPTPPQHAVSVPVPFPPIPMHMLFTMYAENIQRMAQGLQQLDELHRNSAAAASSHNQPQAEIIQHITSGSLPPMNVSPSRVVGSTSISSRSFMEAECTLTQTTADSHPLVRADGVPPAPAPQPPPLVPSPTQAASHMPPSPSSHIPLSSPPSPAVVVENSQDPGTVGVTFHATGVTGSVSSSTGILSTSSTSAGCLTVLSSAPGFPPYPFGSDDQSRLEMVEPLLHAVCTYSSTSQLSHAQAPIVFPNSPAPSPPQTPHSVENESTPRVDQSFRLPSLPGSGSGSSNDDDDRMTKQS